MTDEDQTYEVKEEKQERGRSASSLVPEVLLSSAKDARYLQQCQRLIASLLEAFSNNSNTDNSHHTEALATVVSSILYSLLVLWPQKRTLGMQVTGLDLDHERQSARRLAMLSVGTAISVYTLKWLRNRYHQSQESLRGASRREVFERQRRAMLERANHPNSNHPPETAQKEKNPSSRRRLTSFLEWIVKETQSTALEGPHNNAEEIQHQQDQRSWIQWLMRLHLAFYCIHGSYASWMHRLLGISYHQKNDTPSRIPHRPNTYRVVGLMILAHAAGTGIVAVSKTAVRACVDYYLRSKMASAATNSSSNSATPNSIQPSSSHVVCGICHGPRLYPACPITCGHVFCWTCLHRWIKSVRPECPLCRKPCAAQEIIPIFNYDPE